MPSLCGNVSGLIKSCRGAVAVANSFYYCPVAPLSLLLSALLLLSSPGVAQILSITHVNVIDTETGEVAPDRTVTIEGTRIRSVNPSKAQAPTSGKVIDGRGKYLIPGLWDMHTHVYFDRTASDGDDLILPLFIANGITSIRDMGSNLDAVLRAREQVYSHHLLGPRMIVSGPMLDGPRSSYKAAIPISTPGDGRNAVDMLKQRGVNFIKVQSGVPREAYFAIADEAKKVNIPFEGHVPDAVRASEAIASGQRTFEHLIGIFEASSPDETKYLTGTKSPGLFLASYDPARETAVIRLLAEHHVWQCPTLFWERGQWLVDVVDYTKDPNLSYAAHTWVADQWPKSRSAILHSLDTDPLPTRQHFVTHELDLVRKLRSAGVPFLAGTDTPAGVDVIPGISLHLELQRFVAAGFTPLQALQTATLNPARFYGTVETEGTVRSGRRADLVLLEANPLDDIVNTQKISCVVADGRFFSKQDLSKLREKLRQRAAGR